MTIEVKKPDLLAVINRRGRTLEEFLAELGVSDRKTLDRKISLLKSHYTVSDTFIKQAYLLVPSKPVVKIVEEPVKIEAVAAGVTSGVTSGVEDKSQKIEEPTRTKERKVVRQKKSSNKKQ